MNEAPEVEVRDWAWCCNAAHRCLGIGVPGVIVAAVELCDECWRREQDNGHGGESWQSRD